MTDSEKLRQLDRRVGRLERRVFGISPAPVPDPEPPPPDPIPDPIPTPDPVPAPIGRITFQGINEHGLHVFEGEDQFARWKWAVNSPDTPVWNNSPAGSLRPGSSTVLELERRAPYPPQDVGHPDWAEALLAKDAAGDLPRIWLPERSRFLGDSHGGSVIAPHYHWRLCSPDGVFLAEEGMLRTWRYAGILKLDENGEGVTSLPQAYTWALAQGPWDTVDQSTVHLPTQGMPRTEGWQLEYASRFELSHFLRQWRETEMMARVGCIYAKWLIKQTWIDCLRWLVQDHTKGGTWRPWNRVRDEDIFSRPAGEGSSWAQRALYHLVLILRAFETHWPGDPLLWTPEGMTWQAEFSTALAHAIRVNGTSHYEANPPSFYQIGSPGLRVWQNDLVATQHLYLGLTVEHARYLEWRKEDGPTPVGVHSPTLKELRITEMQGSPVSFASYYDALYFERPLPPGPGGQNSISAEVPDAHPSMGLWG